MTVRAVFVFASVAMARTYRYSPEASPLTASELGSAASSATSFPPATLTVDPAPIEKMSRAMVIGDDI